MTTIEVIKRGESDFTARIADTSNKGYWESGKTPEEALGKLFLSFQTTFRANILMVNTRPPRLSTGYNEEY